MSVVCTLPAAPKPEHDGIRQARNELWFDVRIRAHLADLRLRLLFAGEEVDDRDVVTEAHRGGRDHTRSMQLTSARRSHVTERCRSALSPAAVAQLASRCIPKRAAPPRWQPGQRVPHPHGA